MEIKNLCFSHDKLSVFNNLNLSIKEGEVTVILGPSGCGKTTLLNLISGSLSPKSGKLEIPQCSKISYLYQEPRLLPWKNVENNIRFVLDSMPINQREQKLNQLLSDLELEEFRRFYPHKLSGGMKQRVSIARAFAFPSNTLLMDEPFKGLDLPLKLNLFRMFNRVWRKEEKTAILVTHDIQEAVQLGGNIIVLTKNPTTVKKIYKNPLKYNNRELHKREILELEQKLYKLMI